MNSEPKKVFISPTEILLMFHKGNFRIQPLLKVWEELNGPWVLSHFSNILDELNITKNGNLKTNNSFSDEEFEEIICTWIESEEVRALFRNKIKDGLINKYEKFTEKELEELSWKYEILN